MGFCCLPLSGQWDWVRWCVFCRAVTICWHFTQSAQSPRNLHVRGQFPRCLYRLLLLWSDNSLFIFSNWVNICSSAAQPVILPHSLFIHRLQNPRTGAHMASPAPHSTPASVPVVIMPACPPVDCFLWVLQQHRTGHKSHCIIAAPCFASRSARPPRASDWPVPLLGRPHRAGHRCNRKSRLLPWGRWLAKGLSLNCQSCSFLCASHSVLLPATRWVRSDETRCIPTETYWSRLITAEVATRDWPGRTDPILFSDKNIFVSSHWIV